MTALKFLKAAQTYHGYYKQIDDAANKLTATSKALNKRAKGKPDPDDLRNAILGSDLAPQGKKLKAVDAKLAKLASDAASDSLVSGLPDFTFADLGKFIRKKPTLEDMQRLRDNMQGAHDILLPRFMTMMEAKFNATRQLAMVNTALDCLAILDKTLTAMMKVPLMRDAIQVLWFDVRMMIIPVTKSIAGSLGSTVKSIDRMEKTAIQRLELYREMVKTLKRMIKEEERKSTA